MDVTEALLESWNRQSRIVNALADRVTEANRKVKPSEDGWPLDQHLAHIHQTRTYWLSTFAPDLAASLPRSFTGGWGSPPIESLDGIKACLTASGSAIGQEMRELLANNAQAVGGYDHPLFFLQHMIWHEGWHVGLIMLGLRLNNEEPPEEWEEAHLWGEWRVE